MRKFFTYSLTRRVPACGAVLLILYVSGCLNVSSGTMEPEGKAAGTASGELIELGAGFVHYELSGSPDAQTVVLIHGFSAPYYVWDPTATALQESGFRTLRYDIFGRGWSDRPRVRYDLDLYVSQLDELLATLAIQSPVDLVAFSMGGLVAADFACRFPGRVRRVCLFAPQSARLRGRDIFPLNVPIIGGILMGVYVGPNLLPRSQAEDFYPPENFPDWEAHYRDSMEIPGFNRAMLSSLRNLMKVDTNSLYNELGELDYRILLLWSREDQTIAMEDIELVIEAVPGIEFHIIEEAGHLAHYERALEVNPLLVEFLSRS